MAEYREIIGVVFVPAIFADISHRKHMSLAQVVVLIFHSVQTHVTNATKPDEKTAAYSLFKAIVILMVERYQSRI